MNFADTVVAIDDFGGDIHIRTNTEDPPLYAVFDDIEQVSKRYTVNEYDQAVSFARGYEEAMNRV